MRKSALFMKHLPYIENKIFEGYKLDEVVMLLKLEHNFDMKSSSNLSNYLSRFRPKLPQDNQLIEKIRPTEPAENKVIKVIEPKVAEVEKLPQQNTSNNLKKARELLDQERQKLNISDLIGAV